MQFWLINIIVVICLLVLVSCLVGAMLIKFGKIVSAKNQLIKELNKKNAHNEQLLNAYGIKEIKIGGDN